MASASSRARRRASYSTAGVLAGVLSLSAIVLLMNLMLRPLRHALRWQQEIDVKETSS